jgi:Tol biopolymer transport system component
MSADGKYVAFDSTDSDLVAGDNNNAIDVFLRDVVSQETECISRAPVETHSATVAGMNLGSIFSSSREGSRVAFTAAQRAFFEGSTNDYRQLFVRDFASGMNLLASPDTEGHADAMRNCANPLISADGRKVVFSSVATNLVAGDTNNFEDIFIRDLETGQTALVSLSRDSTNPGNGHSTSPLLSQNDHYVLFWTRASNLAASSAPLLLRDLQLGTNYAIGTSSTTRGTMTPDGQFVAFSTSSGTVTVWSTAQQALVFTTNSVPLRSLAISADGKRIAGLTAGGVLLVDRALNTTQWLGSASSAALPMHCSAQFSDDGQHLVFATPASLSNADTNAMTDVYLYAYGDETTTLISHPSTGDPVGNGRSDSAALSPNGRYVAFRSAADNLVAGDTNGVPDVFLYDTQTREMIQVSNGFGPQSDANDRSLAPAFSGDGKTLFFLSAASNMATNDLNRALDLFSLRISGGSSTPLFVGQILYQPASSTAPIIVWPVVEGKTYHVEYKDQLSDPEWTTLSTSIQINGGHASATDPTPHSVHRYYRIAAQ